MTKKSTKKYLSNANILVQLELSKAQNQMTNDFCKMMQLLCDRYGSLSCFAGYTYLEDMKGYAMLNLIRNWRTFDAEKSQNPFSYYTQSVHNSFIQYLKSEKKQRNIRDKLLVDQGLDPSYTYALEYSKIDGKILEQNTFKGFNPEELLFIEPSQQIAQAEHHD